MAEKETSLLELLPVDLSEMGKTALYEIGDTLLDLPMRFRYGADVFHNSSTGHRELRQVGVKLVRSDTDLADAEVIALAVTGKVDKPGGENCG